MAVFGKRKRNFVAANSLAFKEAVGSCADDNGATGVDRSLASND